MRLTRSVLALAVCASVNISAQMIPVPPPMGGEYIKFVSAEFGPEGAPVKGAPYSAQATVTSTQTLTDGNRIINKSSSFLARDSEGRTRREQTIQSVGPWATGQSPVSLVFINDPQAQVNYVLDPTAHTARKSTGGKPFFFFDTFDHDAVVDTAHTARKSTGGKLETAQIEKMKAEVRAAGLQEVKVVTQTGAVAISGFEAKKAAEAKVSSGQSPNMVMESLGTKTIEGVQAEGKRFTRTVPAGEIGNERALVFVNEVWTSPELHAVVMSRHVDPQAGETVYTLTNIQLAEPDPALFSVPADYTVTDAPKTVRDRRER